MKQGFARIAIILDRSGSMASCRESTVTGFNEFIKTQKAIPGDCLVSLHQFDHELEHVFTKQMKDVPELTQATFVPRGSTALVYAQGEVIVGLGKELEATPEHERPDRVCVMVLTDGEENHSQHFVGEDKKPIWTVEKLAALIKQQQEQYNWDFVFLGANQDAVAVGATMNFQAAKSMTFASTHKGVRNTMRSMGNYMNAYRSAVSGQSASMNSAFSEEDRKEAVEK